MELLPELLIDVVLGAVLGVMGGLFGIGGGVIAIPGVGALFGSCQQLVSCNVLA